MLDRASRVRTKHRCSGIVSSLLLGITSGGGGGHDALGADKCRGDELRG